MKIKRMKKKPMMTIPLARVRMARALRLPRSRPSIPEKVTPRMKASIPLERKMVVISKSRKKAVPAVPRLKTGFSLLPT